MKTIQAQTVKRLLSLALSLALFHAFAATAQVGNSTTLGDFEAQPPATAPADTTAPVGKMQKTPPRTPASRDGQSKWKLISQSKDGRNYSDAASVRREGPTVVVRQMIDYREGFTSDFRSVIGFYAYNCNRRTMKLLSVKSYKGSMGEGALFEESTEPTDLGSPAAGNVGEANFNFACNANPVNP
jgi:hypothetical protein